jgi:hypothetical protein
MSMLIIRLPPVLNAAARYGAWGVSIHDGWPDVKRVSLGNRYDLVYDKRKKHLMF